MKRQIKFRVWNPDDKKMETPLVLAIVNDGTLNFKPLINCSDGNKSYKDYPLMQFTGRKDINGKDIYEGDIIEEGKVLFCNESLGFFVEGKDELKKPLYDIPFTTIIGNIYEKPKEEIKNNVSVQSRIKHIKNERDLKIIDFIINYSFKDSEEIYTNGTILVPLYRVLDAILQNGEEYQSS